MSDSTEKRMARGAGAELMPPLAYGDPVRSILLLKLDHIGDFFTALPPMRRLREAFAGAHITLVCGPWNVELARSVGLFNEIIPFTFFVEETRTLEHSEPSAGHLSRVHRRFHDLVRGKYDLAIDLRYDTETRRLLTLVDAKRRVGVGDPDEFPFLDVAVPSERRPVRPERRRGESSSRAVPFQAWDAPVTVTPARKDLLLRFDVHDPITPVAFGLSSDCRALGISLSRLRVSRTLTAPVGWHSDERVCWPVADRAAERQGRRADKPLTIGETIELVQGAAPPEWFESGFSDTEPCGTWTVGPTAELRIPVEVGLIRPLQLHLRVEAFAPRARARSFHVMCNDAHIARVSIDHRMPTGTLVADIPPRAVDETGAHVRSQDFFLETGECTVRVMVEGYGAVDSSGRSSITVEVVNAIGRVLAQRTVSGPHLLGDLRRELEFRQDDPDLPLKLRIITRGLPFAAGFTLHGLELSTRSSGHLPRLHMTDWIGLVADVAIRHFAPKVDQLGLEQQLPDDVEASFERDRKSGRKIFMMAIGTSKDVTKWPIEYFDELAGLLLNATGSTIYLVGAPREHREAQRIVDRHGGHGRVVNLCGATSLIQFGSLAKQADLFIGGSTGTTHGAAMSGVPTIALLSGVNHPQQWAPVGANATFLARAVPCSACHILFMSECAHGFRCMRELTPEIVLERALSLLQANDQTTTKVRRLGERHAR